MPPRRRAGTTSPRSSIRRRAYRIRIGRHLGARNMRRGLCRIRMGRHPFAGARPFPHLLSFFVHGIVRRMRTSVSYLTCPGASQHTHTNKPTRPVGEILPLREPGVPVRLGDVWNTARIITVTAMGPSVFSEMRDDRRWKWSHGFGL